MMAKLLKGADSFVVLGGRRREFRLRPRRQGQQVLQELGDMCKSSKRSVTALEFPEVVRAASTNVARFCLSVVLLCLLLANRRGEMSGVGIVSRDVLGKGSP
jgi:hypothetical protein